MSDTYTFRLLELDDAELEQTSALLRLVFPKARHLTPRYLRWQYAGNPDGPAIGCNAYDGGRLVGTMAARPMIGRLEGEERPGLFMVNGAIHPDHRGRKLQSRISAAMFEESVSRGFDFCFGTGNKYSTGPLLTRFKMVKQLDAYIGAGLPAHTKAPPLPSFEHTWSPATMEWRMANPEKRYRSRRVNGSSLVTAATRVPGLDAVVFEGPGRWPRTDPPPSRARLRLWLGLDPTIDWSRSSFVSIPRSLRPSPLNLVFKDLAGGSYVPDPERVVFRVADFDPY